MTRFVEKGVGTGYGGSGPSLHSSLTIPTTKPSPNTHLKPQNIAVVAPLLLLGVCLQLIQSESINNHPPPTQSVNCILFVPMDAIDARP